MKPETILNAMGKQGWSVNWPADLWDDNVAPSNVIKARRQYHTFRNRILKMFAEKDARIAEWNDSYNNAIRRNVWLVEKNKHLEWQIAELTNDTP